MKHQKVSEDTRLILDNDKVCERSCPGVGKTEKDDLQPRVQRILTKLQQLHAGVTPFTDSEEDRGA